MIVSPHRQQRRSSQQRGSTTKSNPHPMKNITPDYIIDRKGNKHANTALITNSEIVTIASVIPGCEIIGSQVTKDGVFIDHAEGVTNAAESLGVEAAKAVYAKIAYKAVKSYKADQSLA